MVDLSYIQPHEMSIDSQLAEAASGAARIVGPDVGDDARGQAPHRAMHDPESSSVWHWPAKYELRTR